MIGKVGVPVKITATGTKNEFSTNDPNIILRVALDRKSVSFTPTEKKIYTIIVIEDGKQRKVEVDCREIQPTPEPTPSPQPTGVLWDSNINGKWNDGNKRTITVKQGGQTPDDKSIFVAASGSPKLVIDGDGIAHLVSGSGGVDNLSLKLRSRHQEGGDCANRFGGHGCSIDSKEINFKTESCHNEHENSKSFSHGITIGQEWHHIQFTCKDLKVGCSVDGKKIGEHSITISNGSKEKCDQNSYFWIRLNNADHGRIYVMAKNYNSALDLDFKFEPSTNSIGLKNVRLTAI